MLKKKVKKLNQKIKISTMITFLAFESLGFWIFYGAISIIIITLLSAFEEPRSGWATIFIIASFCCLYWFGSKASLKDLLDHIVNHPFETIGLFFTYVFIGVLWSFVEWYWYCIKCFEEYKQEQQAQASAYSINKHIPLLKDEKGRIFTWIFYWPWVMIWKCIHKPFQRLYDIIMKWTESTYNNISNKIFSKFQQSEEKK